MTSEKELERTKSIQRVTNAYHRVFGGEDGKTVVENLKAYFRMNRPAFERSLGRPFDPIAAAVRDGQREVVLFIEHKLSLPVVGDADVETPKTAVLKA
jgi:hypothetical protein